MSDLTLEQKTKYAQHRAAEETAEKHYFDIAQPFFPLGFSVVYRNPGHWDVMARQCPGKVAAFLSLHAANRTTAKDGDRERAFRIRGNPVDVVVIDERWNPHKPPPTRDSMRFKSVMGAMLWIMEELMQEPTLNASKGGAS